MSLSVIQNADVLSACSTDVGVWQLSWTSSASMVTAPRCLKTSHTQLPGRRLKMSSGRVLQKRGSWLGTELYPTMLKC
jgi:hypothetical protein